MDIGDPSEIPTTRKKLPSMQELGAFDAEPPRQKPLPQPSPPAPPAPTIDQPTPDSRPARPTNEQLRAALNRADPATRSKLLRLIAGGRAVEQTASPAATTARPTRGLAMNLHRSPVSAEAAAVSDIRQSTRPPQQRPRMAATAGSAGETLLKIDANTDLLDAAAPPLSAEQRKAALQQQLDASLLPETPRGESPSAPKVLFPAYNPQEHGSDVRRPTRRSEAPVEGHFPAPRQPFQARYQHADGRPMNEEETKVEAVLQEQRCEQTLEVLARDGVNGLLLSPRDLDAAVENGTLDEATATLLWKTWSALRPVIHVIDEPAPPSADEPAEPTPAIDSNQPDGEKIALIEGEAPAVEPAPPEGAAAVVAVDAVRLPAPVGQASETEAEAGGDSTESSRTGKASADPIPQPMIPEPGCQPRAAIQAPPESESRIETATATAPWSESESASRSQSESGCGSRSGGVLSHRDPNARSVSLMRQLLRTVAALCVLHTGVQFGAWAWVRWGHWLGG